MRAAAVLLAGGSSTRMSENGKKEFLEIQGKPLLLWSVDRFREASFIEQMVIVGRSGDRDTVTSLMKDSPFPWLWAEGGKTRQHSVCNGLLALAEPCDYVFIHDGARPFLSRELIYDLATCASEHGACIPVEPSVNAMKELDLQGRIIRHLKRETTVSAQTPQVFPFPAILNSHQKALHDGFSCVDDSEIWSHYQGTVYTVQGSPENRKITYPHDLERSR